MPASDFRAPERRQFRPWQRYVSCSPSSPGELGRTRAELQEQGKFNPGHIVPWGRAGGYMIRRGERGGSEELLTQEQRRQIDDACRAQLLALGSDFPYDEAFAAR